LAVSDPLFLPALQGSFGDWTYYNALVPLSDVVERVGYATPLQENQSLARQIQRRLDVIGRAGEISDYLVRTPGRFFNALVVGVLGGAPSWHPFTLSSSIGEHELGATVERDQDLVGYLELRGDETLFALDGQHRLAGIKRALQVDPDLGREKVSIIFVPHQDTPEGLIRTRSLFISLNKRAVAVNRKDIIILDEVDLPAIVTRRLVDSDPRFSTEVIDVDGFTNSIPAASRFWTTIGNFYDANRTIIYDILDGRNEEELKDAARVRLPEDRLDFYQAGVVDFWGRLAQLEPLLERIFAGQAEEGLAGARTPTNPRLLARPIGMKIMMRVAAKLRENRTMAVTMRELRRIPLVMTRAPFAGVIWDAERERMMVSGESLATRLLMYMLGITQPDARLRQSYADWFNLDIERVRLPNRLPR
jgi:DNA sulfur modification protein DndB